jgi:hypothetical protein
MYLSQILIKYQFKLLKICAEEPRTKSFRNVLLSKKLVFKAKMDIKLGATQFPFPACKLKNQQQ